MRWTLCAWVLVLGATVGGCVKLSQASEAEVAALASANKDVAAKLAEVILKGRDGSLTANEALEAAAAFQAQMDANAKAIAEIKASESLTTGGLLGAVGGIAGRSMLHALPAVGGLIPGPLGALLSLLGTVLLGGSATKKKDPA